MSIWPSDTFPVAIVARTSNRDDVEIFIVGVSADVVEVGVIGPSSDSVKDTHSVRSTFVDLTSER